MRVVDKEIQYFLSLFHHVFFCLYNIIRSDRVYWGLIGWKWRHLLKLRPRSRSFSSYSNIAKRGGQWGRRRSASHRRVGRSVRRSVGDTDNVSDRVCRRTLHARYDRPSLRGGTISLGKM